MLHAPFLLAEPLTPPLPGFLIYSLDHHMAAIPALDLLCHHALTLIGLICFSFFPSALEGVLGTQRLDVSRQDFQLSFIRVPGFHIKITALSLSLSWQQAVPMLEENHTSNTAPPLLGLFKTENGDKCI